jgi:pimeloyl-ACP methyl ester carboxylesterase
MPTTTLNGTELHYELSGEGPPLLLIAGLAGDHHAWDYQITEYGSRHRCVRLDNRGVGLSGKPKGPYSTKLLAEDAIALLDHLGIERAHVAGQSMGGAIVQQLAVNWPERVLSTSIHCSWARCSRYLKEVFASWSTIRRNCTLAEYNRHVLTWIVTPRFFEGHAEELARIRDGMDNPTVVQPWKAFDAQAQACSEHDTLDALMGVEAPTLVTVGDQDIFTPVSLSEEITERIPSAVLHVIANAGHCLFWERAAEFNRVTLDFLSRHNDPGNKRQKARSG